MKSLSQIDELKSLYDVAVIGAGPAGLCAAVTAATHGLDVLVVDENVEIGGQIYRGLRAASANRRRILGSTYTQGDRLLQEFCEAPCDYLPGGVAWMATRGLDLGISKSQRSRVIQSRRLILATGAYERPFPISGWSLPGVLTVGAAQSLLKASGMVPAGRFVIAGTGPLLWLFASQVLAAGRSPVAILDTTPGGLRWELSAALPAFLTSRYFPAGMGLIRRVRSRVPVFRGVTRLSADGVERVSGVTFQCSEGPPKSIDVDTLLLHQGIVPNAQLLMAAGCATKWNEAQACWEPAVDSWGESSIESIAIAGDGAGIAGAEAAGLRGRLCGLDAACKLGRLSAGRRDDEAKPLRRQLEVLAR